MSGLYTNGVPAAVFPLTGNELVPADTTLTQGQQPESEAISISQIRGFERPVVALTDGATITPDASVGNMFSVTLGGNRTLANPTNLQSGQGLRFEITQDGTGTRTLAFGNKFKFSGSSTISTNAGYTDLISCNYDGTNLLCTLATHFA